uniref:SMP-30/Gluconolactonase/LRE-like region domain-containing protein n=1 Tax=Branchiostoma floridae TaxID=7739 RepID=C3YLM9_BRAFL|eukprot:XP_002602786.1 hypothetical protein BRAFLDRAFT_93732 [Branchiostoma floridae]
MALSSLTTGTAEPVFSHEDNLEASTIRSETTQTDESSQKDETVSSNRSGMITSTDSRETGAYAVPPIGDTGNIPNIQQNNLYLNPIQNAIRDHNTMYAQTTLDSDQNHGQNTSSYNPLYLPSDESANPTFVSNPQPESRLLETSEPQILETSSVTVGETAEAVTVVSARATGNEDLKDDTAQGRPGTGNEESASSRQADIDDSIQPYAVRYHDDDMLTSSASQNGETGVVTSDNVDIQPYAVAYMGQDDVASSEETRTKDASHQPCSHKRATASNSSPGGTEDSADSKNDLITNQMYQPGQPAAAFGSRYRRTCLAVFMTTLVVSSILGGILSVVLNLTIPESTTILPTNDSSLIATPTLPSALTSSQAKEEEITFGGQGTDSGEFDENLGVAVSADHEIFVTDLFNRRVQVYNMRGVHLRLFPTIVPGKNGAMLPFGVAIDGEGDLWAVVRKDFYDPNIHAVQYKKDGHPLTMFDVDTADYKSWYPSIAVDVANNRIIVAVSDELNVFQPNGSHLQNIKAERGVEISCVTTDNNGHILVTDTANTGMPNHGHSKPGSNDVHVYDRQGDWLFKFGALGGKDRLRLPRGICADTAGNIFVADEQRGSVIMFTSRGEFVRTVVRTMDPRAIALGPDGQLVVTNTRTDTVTIFPKQMVSP